MQGLNILTQNDKLHNKNEQPPKSSHVVMIDGARYEVISNYNGSVSILDIFKQMLKRDIERMKP